MEYKLIQGQNSNYEVEVNINKNELNKYEDKVLKYFQKDFEMPGFRKGHVPLSLVKKSINPEYIKAGIYEEIINEVLKKILEEYKDKKFIGNIYDLIPEEKEDKLVLRFKIDVYPEVKVKNENWQTIKIKKISDRVTKKEVEEVIKNLKKQYAEYKDIDKITENSVVKFKLLYLKDGKEIENGTTILGPEDFQEYKDLAKEVIGKNKEEKIVLKYDEKKLPAILHAHKSKETPEEIILIPIDIKEIILPEFNLDKLKQLFGEEFKSMEEFENRIKEEIKKAKFEQGLVKEIEEYLTQVSDSFEVSLPKTLIEEEIKARLKSLEQRFGGPQGLEKYLKHIGEDKVKELYKDIENASRESLKKFLILQKIVELLDIKDVDWQKPLDVERKIYDKMVNNNK